MPQSNRNRSRPYPAFDLRSSQADFLQLKELGDSEVLARGLGDSSGEGGAAIRRIAAMVHYGFLERDGNEYVPAELGQQLLDLDTEEDSYEEDFGVLKLEALKQPEVFAEALEPYEDGEVERDGLAKFFQEAGITRKASGRVADIFLRSCEFAGVEPPPVAPVREVEPVEPKEGEAGGWLAQGRPLHLGPSEREGRLSLALIRPKDLDSTEREILRKRLEFELNLELGDPFGFQVQLTDVLTDDAKSSGEVADLKEFRERKESG